MLVGSSFRIAPLFFSITILAFSNAVNPEEDFAARRLLERATSSLALWLEMVQSGGAARVSLERSGATTRSRGGQGLAYMQGKLEILLGRNHLDEIPAPSSESPRSTASVRSPEPAIPPPSPTAWKPACVSPLFIPLTSAGLLHVFSHPLQSGNSFPLDAAEDLPERAYDFPSLSLQIPQLPASSPQSYSPHHIHSPPSPAIGLASLWRRTMLAALARPRRVWPWRRLLAWRA
jgi:hypothetical protein